MALLPIIQYPDPVLAAKAEPVTEFNDELRKLAADMAETMYAAPGVGLAANQVGRKLMVAAPDAMRRFSLFLLFFWRARFSIGFMIFTP